MPASQKAQRLKRRPCAFRLSHHAFQLHSLLASCLSGNIGMNIIMCNAYEILTIFYVVVGWIGGQSRIVYRFSDGEVV